jgi:hypothetical protein
MEPLNAASFFFTFVHEKNNNGMNAVYGTYFTSDTYLEYGIGAQKSFRMSRKKQLQFSPIDVIFNLVENIGLNKIGTRIHSGHGYVARDYSLGK